MFQKYLKSFHKEESDEVKECGNCCSSLQKKALFKGCANSKRCPRKGIKLFVFFLCTGVWFCLCMVYGFLYQTWSFLQIFQAYPTTLEISEEYPDSFPAPAVTVCNANRLSRQGYCKMYPEKCTWEHASWESFCNANRRMCPETEPPDFNFGDRSDEFLSSVAPEEEANIISEYIADGMEDSNSTIVYLKYKKNGLPYRCYTIFSLMLNYNTEDFNLTLGDGYLVVLDLHPEDYFNTYDLVQASVALHDPRKLVNPLTEGTTLKAGKIYRLFATIDCIKLCKIDIYLLKFGCVGQTQTYTGLQNYEICEDPSYEITSEEYRECADFCPDACEENIYHVSVDDDFDFSGSCPPTDEHCKNRRLILYVNFNRMKIKKFKQIPRFEDIELFSYIGGYLGLWLGISLASVFDLGEMTYDVINNAFLKRARNKKRTTHIEQLQLHTAVNK